MIVFIILCVVGYALNFCTPKCVLDDFVHLCVPIFILVCNRIFLCTFWYFMVV